MSQKQIPVRFTGPEELELYEFLRKESFDTGLPMAEIVRRGINLYKTQKEDGIMRKIVIIEAGIDYTDKLEAFEANVSTVAEAIKEVEKKDYIVIPNDEGGQNEICDGYIAVTVYPKADEATDLVEKAVDQIVGDHYVRLMDKARFAATDSGIFTDDEGEWDQNSQYLVKDMADVIQAFFNDYAVREVFGIDPAEADDGAEAFCERHGIDMAAVIAAFTEQELLARKNTVEEGLDGYIFVASHIEHDGHFDAVARGECYDEEGKPIDYDLYFTTSQEIPEGATAGEILSLPWEEHNLF